MCILTLYAIFPISISTILQDNSKYFEREEHSILFPAELLYDDNNNKIRSITTTAYSIKSEGNSINNINNNNKFEYNAKFDPIRAKNYLISLYNSTVKLLHENETMIKYWLWSDNILASKVLKGYDDNISRNIANTIHDYKLTYNIDMLSQFAVLVDSTSKSSFKQAISKNLIDNIWYTNYDGGSVDLSCSEYADVAFLKSLYFYNNNDINNSKICYDKAVSMFDGIGFKDKAFYADGNSYATYKIALWKIASTRTGFADTRELTNLIGDLQNRITGGIYTHYASDLLPRGFTNAETTSLVVMAFDINCCSFKH